MLAYGCGSSHSKCSLQDIAALTLARDLRDLRPAQQSGACSPRLPGVAQAPWGSWPPLRWSGGHVILLVIPPLLGPTGTRSLDDPPDLSCKDSTRQHAVDDPRLSCKQAHPPDRAAAENAIQPKVLPQQQVDQHRQCHRGDNREQHHEQAAESATERADLQVPEAHAGRLTADRNRKPSRRHPGRWPTARRPLATPASGQPLPDSANRRRGRGSSKPLPLEDSFPEGEWSRGRFPAVRVVWRRGQSRPWRLRGRWP
jgi:hypothetical protein